MEECKQITLNNEGQRQFRQLLFAKVVPAIKRIGLLSDRQRARFHDLGILQFEDWEDPFEELNKAEAEFAEERERHAAAAPAAE
ncbi:MAG: hypothetical protein GY944_10940 [bacterium]|nr:hypothetical protein [bacterium]